MEKYTVGSQVRFIVPRCACVGGGRATLDGTIKAFHGDWVEILSNNTIYYTKKSDIVQ